MALVDLQRNLYNLAPLHNLQEPYSLKDAKLMAFSYGIGSYCHQHHVNLDRSCTSQKYGRTSYPWDLSASVCSYRATYLANRLTNNWTVLFFLVWIFHRRGWTCHPHRVCRELSYVSPFHSVACFYHCKVKTHLCAQITFCSSAIGLLMNHPWPLLRLLFTTLCVCSTRHHQGLACLCRL